MCAQIFPAKEDISDMPYSELLVYDYLSSMSDTYTVFHSVRWVKRGSRWKSTWKENDYLILNRSLGILVLEVKGGEIECKGSVFHQINTKTGDVNVLDPNMKKDPLSQAIDGVYHYRSVLDRVASGLQDRFPIEAAVWFPGVKIGDAIDKFPLGYREISDAVLGSEAFDKKGAIHDIFESYKSRKKVDITDEEYKSVVEAIARDFNLISAPSIRKGELDHAFLKLTNEQTGLLDYISEQGNATIQGVAGTGKTLIAKEAARRFGAEGHRVLFLCFNRFLYQYLMRQYPYENVTYFNIHSFIVRYGGEGEDLSNTKNRAKALIQIDWDSLDYDDIVIDEAQDFDNDEILYFKDYVELRDGHFFVFYDKNQLLTTREVPTWIRDSECRLLLTKNCRNTYEIALTSYNVIDLELNKKVMMVNGEKTALVFSRGNPSIQISKVLKYLTGDELGYEYDEITILSLVKESDSIMNGVNKIHGIPITRERTNSSVMFTTSIKFKGLESKAVIITDIDNRCFEQEEQKRNFYVACSRATQQLILVVNGDQGVLKSIADSIGGSSHFAPKGKIAMKLQANITDFE